MNRELNEEIVKIPLELAKRIQTELKMTPGLDFNTLVIQALNQLFSGKHDCKEASLADLKERYIEDSSSGYGPKGGFK